MQKQLTEDEYVRHMDDVATSRCAVTIRNYFHGDVARFYNACDNFKRHGGNPGDPEYDTAWKALRCYNLAGIENKYVKSVFGRNYYSSAFMTRVWDTMQNVLHYTIVPHGVLTYKGKRHPYFTKYLPPQKKMEAVFASEEEVKRVTSPSSYCNKVRKILTRITTDNSGKAGLDVSKWLEPGVNVPFSSPSDLLNELRMLLFTFRAGTPGCYETVIKTILTPDLYGKVRKEWAEKLSSNAPLNNKFAGAWVNELTGEELAEIAGNVATFLSKVKGQLEGPFASRMFKDEYAGRDKNGTSVWKQASGERIARAREAVDKAIATWRVKAVRFTTEAAD